MALDYWHRYSTDTVGIELMISFCKKYDEIYVYGALETQRLLAKYLLTAQMPFRGFVISWEEQAVELGLLDGFPVYTPATVPKNNCLGILVAVEERNYNDVVPLLVHNGLHDFFFINELNRFAVAQKMRPAARDFFWFEVNIVEHCNLNCQMCDHFSPIAPEQYISLPELEKEIGRMSELMEGECRAIKLEGGEPLLHPQLNDIIRMIRGYFPKGIIYLYTNGLLLKKWETHPNGNLWETCRECGVDISVTEYPISLDYKGLRQLAGRYGVSYNDVTSRDTNGVKYSFHHPFDLSGSQEPYHFINCFCFNNCITLRDGKMYPCSVLPNSHHFVDYYGKELTVGEGDYIDIYQAKSFEEIAEFTANRVPFCRYCDVKSRKAYDWKQSKKEIGEWT